MSLLVSIAALSVLGVLIMTLFSIAVRSLIEGKKDGK